MTTTVPRTGSYRAAALALAGRDPVIARLASEAYQLYRTVVARHCWRAISLYTAAKPVTPISAAAERSCGTAQALLSVR